LSGIPSKSTQEIPCICAKMVSKIMAHNLKSYILHLKNFKFEVISSLLSAYFWAKCREYEPYFLETFWLECRGFSGWI
jgi:hypothetical protein